MERHPGRQSNETADRLANHAEAIRTATNRRDEAQRELHKTTRAAIRAGLPISRAARNAGVTRKVIYRWLDQ